MAHADNSDFTPGMDEQIAYEMASAAAAFKFAEDLYASNPNDAQTVKIAQAIVNSISPHHVELVKDLRQNG